MAGAIAGTAILCAPKATKRLHTVTLTINNSCNMQCPHCYLQYDGDPKLISNDILEYLYKADFKHLSIVGKEPLINKESANLCQKIIRKIQQQGKSVSLITNGIGLKLLSLDILPLISYIDISLDGGPLNYSAYRKTPFQNIISGINYLLEHNFNKINALHVINATTINFICDMASVSKYAPFNHIMFSPYLVTRNHGNNSVEAVEINRVLVSISESMIFMDDPKCFLLLDTCHMRGEHVQEEYIHRLIGRYGLEKKIKLIPDNPLTHGVIRITYDGYILTPYQSINTVEYRDSSYSLINNSIEGIFNNMLSNNTGLSIHAN